MNVVFVCTGNTCRSPLAEVIARRLAAERGLEGLTFSSVGTNAVPGSSASDGSILIAIERGLDLSSHSSKIFEPSMVGDDTIFLALGTSHFNAVRNLAPSAQVYLLSEYASGGTENWSVVDPFGGDLESYRSSANDIEALLIRIMERIAGDRSEKK